VKVDKLFTAEDAENAEVLKRIGFFLNLPIVPRSFIIAIEKTDDRSEVKRVWVLSCWI
jgi:hypothetical protein